MKLFTIPAAGLPNKGLREKALWLLKQGLSSWQIKSSEWEKKLGTSVCADISQYARKNQYVQFLPDPRGAGLHEAFHKLAI